MQSFNELDLPQALADSIKAMGFDIPTPIQAQAIPHALQGLDMLGTAQTGTGKTGAYGIPLVAKILNNPNGTALVLLPTRELAAQVMQALHKFIGRSRVQTALLIGGEGMFKQFKQLQSNPRIIVGTPGRINDHLNRGSLKIDRTDFLVLDEVDRMLDMGFGVQLEEIAKHLPEQRQTLMFSATLPANILKMSNRYLKSPVRISVGDTHAPAANVKQEHIKVSEGEKYPRLLAELETRTGSVIIFIKTKHAADRMADRLQDAGHTVDALHGDLRQNQRNAVVSAFRNQRFRILVATDVAARGLDIPHIEHVINFDLPQSPEDYIHRIGRTARAGAEGHALSFLSPADSLKWRAIQRLLNPDAPQERFVEERRGGRAPARGGFKRNSAPREGGYRSEGPREGGYRSEGRSEGKPRDAAAGGYQREGVVVRDGQSRDAQREGKPFSGERKFKPFNKDGAGKFGKPSGKPAPQPLNAKARRSA